MTSLADRCEMTSFDVTLSDKSWLQALSEVPAVDLLDELMITASDLDFVDDADFDKGTFVFYVIVITTSQRWRGSRVVRASDL